MHYYKKGRDRLWINRPWFSGYASTIIRRAWPCLLPPLNPHHLRGLLGAVAEGGGRAHLEKAGGVLAASRRLHFDVEHRGNVAREAFHVDLLVGRAHVPLMGGDEAELRRHPPFRQIDRLKERIVETRQRDVVRGRRVRDLLLADLNSPFRRIHIPLGDRRAEVHLPMAIANLRRGDGIQLPRAES